MSGRYTFWLTNYRGEYIDMLPYATFQYSQSTNEVGALQLDLDDYDPAMIGPFQFVDVWRAGDTWASRPEARYVILSRPRETAAKGTRFLTVIGYGLNKILDYRIRDESFSDATDEVDDLVKLWVKQTLFYDDTSAVLSGDYKKRSITRFFPNFTVQRSQSKGVSITYKPQTGSMLAFCQAAVKQAAADALNPQYWFFDMVPTGYGNKFGFEFRMYKNQRGVDRTAKPTQSVGSTSPLILARETGELINIQYEVDYSKITTFVFSATGSVGTVVARGALEAADVLRYPLYRSEAYGGPDANLPQMLREGKERKVVRVDFQNSAAVQYQRDWCWGDKVTVVVTGGGGRYARTIDTLTMRIDNVTLSGDRNGGETIAAQLNLVA